MGEGEGTDVSRKVSRQADAEYEDMEEEYMEDDPETKENIPHGMDLDEGIGEDLEESSTLVQPEAETNQAMSSSEARGRRATVLDLVTKGVIHEIKDLKKA